MKRTSVLIALAIFCIIATGFSATTSASTHSAECHGCTSQNMANTAMQTTEQGTVFVFNKVSKDVKKYAVFTEFVDSDPFTKVTNAFIQPTPADLKDDYADWIDLVATAVAGAIDLPGDFPIATIAGALEDLQYFEGQLQFEYRNNNLAGFQSGLRALVRSWGSANIPFASFGSLIAPPRLTIRFSDGSSVEVEITSSYNATTGNYDVSVATTYANSALDSEGNPIPSSVSGLGWSGFSVTGSSMVLAEWIARAQAAGVPFLGPSSPPPTGGTMECEIHGEVIYCEVRENQ